MPGSNELGKGETLELMDYVDDALEGEPEFFKYDEDAPQLAEEANKHRGRPMGFQTLDAITGGISSGELIVVTAPTGVGKTTLCQSISWELAKVGNPCLWYTLEVNLFQFIQPFILNDKKATFDPAGKLTKVSELPIYFPKDLSKLKFKDLKRAIRYAHDNFGVEHVFIDHLHYLIDHKTLTGSGSISLHIGDRLRELRRIALETGVSIFLVAHTAKIEDGKRPTLSDMRDSSFVGQEADLVLVLWRERLKETVTALVDGVEYEQTYSPLTSCAVEKSRRTGRKGVIHLKWGGGLYTEASKFDKEMAEFSGQTPKEGKKKPGEPDKPNRNHVAQLIN